VSQLAIFKLKQAEMCLNWLFLHSIGNFKSINQSINIDFKLKQAEMCLNWLFLSLNRQKCVSIGCFCIQLAILKV